MKLGIEMFKPNYLYVKTHNITGLKYFGKTIRKDPHAYKGSGTYWKQHLVEFGDDVSTEIIGHYLDENICLINAIEFSQLNDIVNSDEWANLKIECLFGGWDYINEKGLNLEENWSEESIKRHREKSLVGAYKGGAKSVELGTGIHGLTETQKKENRIKAKEAMREKYGVESIFSVINKDPVLNAKKKEIFKEIGHQQGEKNSQFGKMWITNEIDSTRILKESHIPDGWRKGRVLKQVY